jgi:hypothetical protein
MIDFEFGEIKKVGDGSFVTDAVLGETVGEMEGNSLVTGNELFIAVGDDGDEEIATGRRSNCARAK